MATATQAVASTPLTADNPYIERITSHLAGRPAMMETLVQESRDLIASFNALVDAVACRSDDAYPRLKSMRRQLGQLARHQKAASVCVSEIVRPLVNGEADELTKVWLAYLSKDARSADGTRVNEGLRHVW